MKRRSFLASLLALPAALVAIVQSRSGGEVATRGAWGAGNVYSQSTHRIGYGIGSGPLSGISSIRINGVPLVYESRELDADTIVISGKLKA